MLLPLTMLEWETGWKSWSEGQTWIALRYQFDMANFSLAIFTNTTNITRREGDRDVPSMADSIIIIIINTITFPFTVILNLLVIKAVKTTPRLRTNNNILLACLAVTDTLTGLLGQPLFILWRIFLIFNLSSSKTVGTSFVSFLLVILVSSYFHLMLVTFERLIAIKVTMLYSNIITEKNMKIAVIIVWITASIYGVLIGTEKVNTARYLTGPLAISCILFLTFAYLIMYRETARHKEKIKTQQLPQEDVERFLKENKALKTTLFVAGAVLVCLLPVGFFFVVAVAGLRDIFPINLPLIFTCAMLNSLVNPLIYCWRQKEMKNVIFGMRTQIVHLDDKRNSLVIVLRLVLSITRSKSIINLVQNCQHRRKLEISANSFFQTVLVFVPILN